MRFFRIGLRQGKAHARNERGQTALEYLLLMATAFVTAYFLVTVPLAAFTLSVIDNIRQGIKNTVRNGEWKTGEQELVPGEAGHPGDENHFQAVHL